jgi:hypothetical protein
MKRVRASRRIGRRIGSRRSIFRSVGSGRRDTFLPRNDRQQQDRFRDDTVFFV